MWTRFLTPLVIASLWITMANTEAGGQHPSPRASCGQKPQFSPFAGEIALATQKNAANNGPFGSQSLMMWDLTNQSTAPVNTWWNPTSAPPTTPYSHAQWDVGTLGDVFGVTLDNNGNVYVAATRIYGSVNSGLPNTGLPAARAGRIYKIDALTGSLVTTTTAFAQLPNDNNGLGNIDFGHNSLYVTNFHDGLIYQLSLTGATLSTFDHGQNLPSALDVTNQPLNPVRAAITGFDGTSSYAALGRRPWAVRVFGPRLFYSIWSENWWRTGQRPNFPNEVWSVALNALGNPVGPPRLEITLPTYSTTSTSSPYTNPVAGMSFGPAGELVLVERTTSSNNSTDAHRARALRYTWSGNAWVLSPPTTFEVGNSPSTTANAAGGVDFDSGPGGRLWVTADYMHFTVNDYIYGLQGFPQTGGNIQNSLLIDLNNFVGHWNKTEIGDVRLPCPPLGQLKVCKVAGPGVAVGTPFTFTAGASTFTVPAGPAPGGTCVVGPTFPVGSIVTVVEAIPAGDTVSSIVVAPPSQLTGAANLSTGTVNVTVGPGVTEVTYTDERTGFLEICKRTAKPAVSGTFTFYVNGNVGPFVVPVGACSPAIQVPAGQVVISESLTAGTAMVGCDTIPAGQQVSCNQGIGPGTFTSTVTVAAGDIAHQTIAFITNRRTDVFPAEKGGTRTALSCAPNPAPLGGAVTCTATVIPTASDRGSPTGAVSLKDGDVELAAVPLGADGRATIATSALAAGSHAIVGAYSGDNQFDASVSGKVIQMVGPR